MKLRAAIVDSDEAERRFLSSNLDFYGLDVTLIAGSYAELEEQISDIQFDVAFISVQLPTNDGFYCSCFLKHKMPDINIVFITNEPEHAVIAFDFEAFDCLMKPIGSQRLLKTVERLKRKTFIEQPEKKPGNRIMVKMRGTYQMINIDGILFIEIRNRKSYMVLEENQEVELQGYTMENLEKMFVPCGFCRCYQSILVNVSKITQLTVDAEHRTYLLKIKDYEHLLPVSRERYARMITLLQESSHFTMNVKK